MPSVLCLDDEPGIREYISDVLTDAGYEVATAVDATDAISRSRTGPSTSPCSTCACPAAEAEWTC